MRALSFLAVWTVTCASSAIAACPGQDALATGGVRLVYGDSAVEVFRRLDAHRVEMTDASTAPVLRDVLGKGLFLLESAYVENGEKSDIISVSYGLPVKDLPDPAPGLSWDIAARETQDEQTATLIEAYRANAAEPVTIGDCTLTAIDVELKRGTLGSVPQVEIMRYFPDLAFAYVHAVGDRTVGLEVFAVSRIEAATP